jgi:hypothetical protein
MQAARGSTTCTPNRMREELEAACLAQLHRPVRLDARKLLQYCQRIKAAPTLRVRPQSRERELKRGCGGSDRASGD